MDIIQSTIKEDKYKCDTCKREILIHNFKKHLSSKIHFINSVEEIKSRQVKGKKDTNEVKI